MRSLGMVAGLCVFVGACTAEVAEPELAADGVELRLTELEPGSGRIEYALINHTASPVSVVRWRTPFDPGPDRLFKVVRDGSEVTYLGPSYYRLPDAIDLRLQIAPGERIARELDLRQLYDVSQGGTFEVRSALDAAHLLPELEQTELTSDPITLEVRAHADDARVGLVRQAATLTNCSEGHFYVLDAVVSQARTRASDAVVAYLSDPGGARAQSWFGEPNSDLAFKIAGALQTAQGELQGLNLNLVCGGDSRCDGGAIALRPPNTRDIIFCDSYWSQGFDGYPSMPHIFVHEVFHVMGMTDWLEGLDGAQFLAENWPAGAAMNPENYAQYITNVFGQ